MIVLKSNLSLNYFCKNKILSKKKSTFFGEFTKLKIHINLTKIMRNMVGHPTTLIASFPDFRYSLQCITFSQWIPFLVP